MTRAILLSLIVTCLVGIRAAPAQEMSEKILPLDGHINAAGTLVELNWFDAQPPRVGSVSINRRLYGKEGGDSWEPLVSGLGPVMRHADDTVRPGRAYEYQVLRTGRDIVDVGYWLAGTQIPAVAFPGNAYVIVDETLAPAIAPRLDRFIRDLTGDGWRVLRRNTPRGDKTVPKNDIRHALEIKNWLRDHYLADPFGQHTIILVGHVPLITSGKAAPDGHEPNPHGTDLFYADVDGRWRINPAGAILDNGVPGDHIEMQIGRIDFSTVSDGDAATETRLLRAYFDKNHHWRTGMIGPLMNAYAQNDNLAVEQAALRNIVGPAGVLPGGHHDLGEREPWLWGVDFGDWQGRNYAKANANKAVFAINFGSWKQQIGQTFNPMNAMLAQPWYTLAVGWGARPAWWLHHMALGGTIGDVHMRTVNNGKARAPYRDSMDYFPTGRYLWRNPVWVNLLGDPTLRAFVMRPPANLKAQPADGGTRLTWTASADPDVTGYKIYRGAAGSTDFRPLNGDDPVTTLDFTDTAAPENAHYMVRAYGLKQVYAGSFYTLSQGVFSRETPLSETGFTEIPAIAAPSGHPVPLPAEFTSVTNGQIRAFVEGPSTGTLQSDGDGWVYMPRAGFSGSVRLRFSVSDSWHTKEGVLRLTIGE